MDAHRRPWRTRSWRCDRLGSRTLTHHEFVYGSAERAKAMGVYGFVSAGGEADGVLLAAFLPVL